MKSICFNCKYYRLVYQEDKKYNHGSQNARCNDTFIHQCVNEEVNKLVNANAQYNQALKGLNDYKIINPETAKTDYPSARDANTPWANFVINHMRMHNADESYSLFIKNETCIYREDNLKTKFNKLLND
jgi:hypothetical protein